MAVDIVHDGSDALSQLNLTRYDVVVLDRDLPGCTATRSARPAAGRSPSRILMLTAAGSLSDRVKGLDLGAAQHPSAQPSTSTPSAPAATWFASVERVPKRL